MSGREKYRHISITGPVHDLDRVLMRYIVGSNMVLENAAKTLDRVKNLRQLPNDAEQYEELVKEAEQLKVAFKIDYKPAPTLSVGESLHLMEQMKEKSKLEQTKLNELYARRQSLQEQASGIEKFFDVDIDFEALSHLQYVECEFGKMPKANYDQLDTYIEKQPEVLVVPGSVTKDSVYLAYFSPATKKAMPDAIFKALHFEKINMPTAFAGTPKDAYGKVLGEIREVEESIQALEAQRFHLAADERGKISDAITRMKQLSDANEIKKNVAVTVDDYYIVSGKIPVGASIGLEKMLEADERTCLLASGAFAMNIKNRR